MEYQWEEIKPRLTFQRTRLELTNDEIKTYLQTKYQKKFGQLTDAEIIELGKAMALAPDKTSFLSDSTTAPLSLLLDTTEIPNPYKGQFATLKEHVVIEGMKAGRILIDLRPSQHSGLIVGRQSGMRKYYPVRLLDVVLHPDCDKAI